MIVVDTSVLILAFRQRAGRAVPPEVATLRRLIEDDAALAVPGIVCQEVLAGARTEQQFDRLERLLDGFPILLADRRLHERAARIAAVCRWSGVAASTADCLIAAHAIDLDASLFSLDRDFGFMAPLCGLRMFQVP